MTSTREEVEIGYDVANDFFRLWLDERMHYSWAVFDERHTTLEQAQSNKSRILADFAEVTPDTLVLDIGCGWGANLEYLTRERMVKRAHGITLSRAQRDEIARRGLAGVQIWGADYRDFTPPQQYDALISIEMVDHLVSPQQQREGLAVAIYRHYFDRVAQWIKPGGSFGFQAILRDRVPRRRKDLEDLQFTADVIFPGGLIPGWKNSSPPAASRGRLSSLSPGARITARPSPSGTSDSRQTGPSSWRKAGAAS